MLEHEKEPITVFNEQYKIWEEQTGMLSNIEKRILHGSFLRIVGIGKPAIPYILKKLSKGKGGVLVVALEAITGTDPVKNAHLHDMSGIIQDWLEWGRDNGYKM